jgi:hypothetical protein
MIDCSDKRGSVNDRDVLASFVANQSGDLNKFLREKETTMKVSAESLDKVHVSTRNRRKKKTRHTISVKALHELDEAIAATCQKDAAKTDSTNIQQIIPGDDLPLNSSRGLISNMHAVNRPGNRHISVCTESVRSNRSPSILNTLTNTKASRRSRKRQAEVDQLVYQTVLDLCSKNAVDRDNNAEMVKTTASATFILQDLFQASAIIEAEHISYAESCAHSMCSLKSFSSPNNETDDDFHRSKFHQRLPPVYSDSSFKDVDSSTCNKEKSNVVKSDSGFSDPHRMQETALIESREHDCLFSTPATTNETGSADNEPTTLFSLPSNEDPFNSIEPVRSIRSED